VGNVLSALVAAIGIAGGTAPPAPSASPAEPALREIGHVHAASAFCKTALETATNGINILLHNDVRIEGAVISLRSTDLDSSDLAKSNGLLSLNRQYVALRAEAVRGDGLLKGLKAQAALAPGDDQKRDLLAFANALDGALGRQRKLADDIGHLITVLANHPFQDADTRADLEKAALMQQTGPNGRGASHDTEGPLHSIPPSLGEIAHTGADELVKRAEPIGEDETRAADLIEPAFAGCQPTAPEP
jgi:hypothetical protein